MKRAKRSKLTTIDRAAQSAGEESVWFEMALKDVVNVSEYEELAKQKLPKAAYDFYATGSDDLWTLRENMRAFQQIRYNLFTTTCV